MSPRKKGSKLTPQHKKALAEGRAEGKAVRNYLEALEATKPKPGRRRTTASIEKRLAKIEEELESANTMKKLHLTSEQMRLVDELNAEESVTDIDALEKAFIKVAASYSARKKISYAAWRKMGVAAATLTAAGISRSS